MTPTSPATPAPAASDIPSRLDATSAAPASKLAHIGDDQLHALILHQLDEDQAIDVVSIPLAGISSIADHMVIASGRSTRQVASMAEKIASRVKSELGGTARLEGLPTADWVLIDAGDVIVHLFRPEVRSFYNLERMWGADGPASPAPARN